MSDCQIKFEVVIVGAGPAGIAAACAASESGRKVLVIDNMPAPGGNIWRGAALHKKKGSAGQWLERFGRCGAQVMRDATVFAAPASHTLMIEAPDGVHTVSWAKLVLAVGARELFIPFPGWTLPNVLGCGGLQALSKTGWPVKGKRIIVAGSGPLLLAAAAQFRAEGANVLLVAEQAEMASLMRFGMDLPFMAPSKVLQAIGLKWSLLGVPFKTGTWVSAARGESHLEGVTLANGSKTWDLACDYLACSYSLVPSLELPLMLGCKVADGVVQVSDRLETSIPDIYCAGEPNGIGGVDTSLVEGQIAGYYAAGIREKTMRQSGPRRRGLRFRAALKKAFELRPELKQLATADTMVCRCEDVSRRRLESFDTWRAAKLHTRCGMGACQGRICGGAVQFLFGWEGASVRPPVLPVSVGALGKCDADVKGG